MMLEELDTCCSKPVPRPYCAGEDHAVTLQRRNREACQVRSSAKAVPSAPPFRCTSRLRGKLWSGRSHSHVGKRSVEEPSELQCESAWRRCEVFQAALGQLSRLNRCFGRHNRPSPASHRRYGTSLVSRESPACVPRFLPGRHSALPWKGNERSSHERSSPA